MKNVKYLQLSNWFSYWVIYTRWVGNGDNMCRMDPYTFLLHSVKVGVFEATDLAWRILEASLLGSCPWPWVSSPWTWTRKFMALSLSAKLFWQQFFECSRTAIASPSLGCGNGRKVTAAGWQVTLCDPTWYVISRSGEMASTNSYICFTYYTSTQFLPHIKNSCKVETWSKTMQFGFIPSTGGLQHPRGRDEGPLLAITEGRRFRNWQHMFDAATPWTYFLQPSLGSRTAKEQDKTILCLRQKWICVDKMLIKSTRMGLRCT